VGISLNPHDHFSQSDNFAVLTIHRPSNVDDAKNFKSILSLLIKELPEDLPILWPVHPRTRKNMEGFGYFNEIADHPKFILLEPLGYLEMLRLNMSARIMLTDSGGLQEECTFLELHALPAKIPSVRLPYWNMAGQVC
jgi:UDP-N-acetylglucosamine 2-epimerase (non-hydrolysing)